MLSNLLHLIVGDFDVFVLSHILLLQKGRELNEIFLNEHILFSKLGFLQFEPLFLHKEFLLLIFKCLLDLIH